MLKDVLEITESWIGPYLCGDYMTLGDVAIAPYMDRMHVLKHYRDFEIPNEEKYSKWHQWSKNILSHPAVIETQQPRDKLLEAYKRYADNTVRSGHYYTYYARPENIP